MGLYSFLVNLAEGFGYILGGTFAHRLGARWALLISAAPMAVGFLLLLQSGAPWVIVVGALLLTNWEPLSVPATFEVVGGEVRKERRTIAFAVQSIQKRLPKVIGPLIGGMLFGLGYRANLFASIGVLALSFAAQWALLGKMKPASAAPQASVSEVLAAIPPGLRRLLFSEILLRWGNWFVRDFASLYVVAVLGRSAAEYGSLAALSSAVALVSYVPAGKMIDRAPSPKPYIGATFLFFALFPFALVWLPLPIAFVINGLRELGEPARKAAITAGLPEGIRARAVGWYWGLRSFAFCPAPLAAWWLWDRFGPEAAFLTGGALGLAATVVFWLRVKLA
jgi:MFS family permease